MKMTSVRPCPKDPGRANAKLSAGFYGIALASHMCGSVDVYGFRAADTHYYKKQAGPTGPTSWLN